MATVIIGLITAAVIFAAAYRVYSDKKKGRTSCGCKCAGCANAHICHSEKTE